MSITISSIAGATGGGVGASTVSRTASDVVAAPAGSVARAVSEYCPAGMSDQVMLYGAVVACPSRTPLAKNCTRAMPSSGSVASAVRVAVAGAVRVRPVAGDVRATWGGMSETGGAWSTTTAIGSDVVAAPEVSVARAVSAYSPAGTSAQVMV